MANGATSTSNFPCLSHPLISLNFVPWMVSVLPFFATELTSEQRLTGWNVMLGLGEDGTVQERQQRLADYFGMTE